MKQHNYISLWETPLTPEWGRFSEGNIYDNILKWGRNCYSHYEKYFGSGYAGLVFFRKVGAIIG